VELARAESDHRVDVARAVSRVAGNPAGENWIPRLSPPAFPAYKCPLLFR